jgi:cytoskeleton protein RodZ
VNDSNHAGFSAEPGAMLRAARESKALDLAKVASLLMVPANVVEAMEANRFEVFDAPVYAKGFLRKYAAILELDPVAVLAAYGAHSGGPAEPTHGPVTPAAPKIRLRVPLRTRLPSLKSVVIAALILALLAGGYWYSGYRTASVRLAAPPVAAKTDADVPAVSAANQSGSAAQSPMAESIPVQSGAPSDQSIPLPAMRVVPPPTGATDEVTIRGVKDAYVQVNGKDGTHLFGDHVRAGEIRTVHGLGPWGIYLSDVEAVELRLGVHIVDVPVSRRNGVEARFSLNANGVIQ